MRLSVYKVLLITIDNGQGVFDMIFFCSCSRSTFHIGPTPSEVLPSLHVLVDELRCVITDARGAWHIALQDLYYTCPRELLMLLK